MGDHFGTQGDAGKGSDTDAAKRRKDSVNLGSTLVAVRLTIDPLVVLSLQLIHW